MPGQSTLTLEICVDAPDSLESAITAGADRIELCSALALGGLTPGPGMMALGAAASKPCVAMIRPRPGDFLVGRQELSAMLTDIRAASDAGMAGIVVGALNADSTLDCGVLRNLLAEVPALCATLHRAFDLTPDPLVALDHAIDLGFKRVLTSGSAASAPEGLDRLAELVAHARGRIEIMAGGGVTLEAIPLLVATGIDAIHASCSVSLPSQSNCQLIGIPARRATQYPVAAGFKAALNS